MQIFQFVLAGAFGLASIKADLAGSITDTFQDCYACLNSGATVECSDECDFIGNADDDINACCTWWSCTSCPESTTTALKVDPPPKTTTTAAPKPTTAKTTTTMTTTTTRTSRPTTTTLPGDTVVATVYSSGSCSGSGTILTLDDFDAVGDLGLSVWDACGDDSSAIETLYSIEVEDGFKVTLASDCAGTQNDNVETTSLVTSESGCLKASDGFLAVVDDPVVAITYRESDCQGDDTIALHTSDFNGGDNDFTWDACSLGDIASDMSSSVASIEVFEPFVATVSTACAGEDAGPEGAAILTADSGCVNNNLADEVLSMDLNAVVATVYEDAGCTGESLELRVADFFGGNMDDAWDACNAKWEDGTDIVYQGGTWLSSIQVSPGFVVTTATQCNDDYTYAEIYYKDEIGYPDGCVDADYDFNHIEFAVADNALA